MKFRLRRPISGCWTDGRTDGALLITFLDGSRAFFLKNKVRPSGLFFASRPPNSREEDCSSLLEHQSRMEITVRLHALFKNRKK